MLHIVNTHKALENCLRFAASDSVILLIQDGVYAAIKHSENDIALEQHQVYALKSDIIARGISDKLHDKIKVVDYDDFVNLTIEYHPTQTWS